MTQPDDLHDDLVVERNADLDLDAEALWGLISTSEGWSSWLVDEADVTIAPEADGTTTDDGVERSVHIDSVIEGSGIRFSWWERGDPSSVSQVQLDIVELPAGRSRLHISERLIGSTTTAAMSCSVAPTWEVRLVSLWLLALPWLVMA
jgi:hypothetical protein